jgi:hypothetical protein
LFYLYLTIIIFNPIVVKAIIIVKNSFNIPKTVLTENLLFTYFVNSSKDNSVSLRIFLSNALSISLPLWIGTIVVLLSFLCFRKT